MTPTRAILARVLKAGELTEPAQWCIYALEEIDTPEARAALRSARQPRGQSKRADASALARARR